MRALSSSSEPSRAIRRAGSFEAASRITIDQRIASGIAELLRNLANTFASVGRRSGVPEDEAEASIRRAAAIGPAGILFEATGVLERFIERYLDMLGHSIRLRQLLALAQSDYALTALRHAILETGLRCAPDSYYV